MIDFFSHLELDKQSFWLGFLAGAISIWLVRKLWGYLPSAFKQLKRIYKEAREGMTSNAELKYRNETLLYLQKMHFTSTMFSLDEIAIPPRLIASPVPMNFENGHQPIDIVNLTLPYLPDWPEMAAKYKAPTLSIPEAMSRGANLIIIGQPGSGRTFSLAHLASLMLRKEVDGEELLNILPVYVHAQDIPQTGMNGFTFEVILKTTSRYLSIFTQQRAPSLFSAAFEKNRALLMIDGLDEVSYDQYQASIEFLKICLEKYPKLRIIVTTSPDNFTGLTQLGLIPVCLASWNEDMIIAHLELFSQNWKQVIHPESGSNEDNFESMMIHSWLESYDLPQTPFEHTLRIWAAYAGDIIGTDISANLEAYIRRTTTEFPDARNLLEKIAINMIVSEQMSVRKDDIHLFIENQVKKSEIEYIDSGNDTEIESESSTTEKINEQSSIDLNIDEFLRRLTHTGLFVSMDDESYGFSHPIIAFYLAGNSYAKEQHIAPVLDQSDWTGKQLSIYFYLHSCYGDESIIDSYIDQEDILHKKTLLAARWLKDGKSDWVWQSKLMRYLARKIQDESITLGLSGRFISALALTNDSNIGALFRKLLPSEEANIRQLAALGIGLIKDIKSIPDVAALLNDPVPGVNRSACLALAAIGNKNALETLVTALIQGNESIKQYAAEALANHREEGHPALRDASNMDDLLVRRAVIFGLARIKEPWALEILERTQLEDQQWLVRNAAVQVMEDLNKPKSNIPVPAVPITDVPWLIEFASKLGIGVVPGKPAIDLIIRSLRDGDEDLRLAALDYLRLNGIDEVIPTIVEIYHTSLGEVREAAFNTIWHLSASGFVINDTPVGKQIH